MCLRHVAVMFLLLVVGIALVSAQGTSVYSFLRDDVGARAAALGGSFVTATDDPNALFYNPASLATLSARRLSVGFFKHLIDINSGSATFGTEVPSLGTVGAGVVYINYGEFQRTGDEGQSLGTFGAGEVAFAVGYGSKIDSGLNYGVNAKFVYSSIADAHSSGVALDFGLQYMAIPNGLMIGASLLNAGTQISPYVNTKESLPLDLSVGASVYPEHLPAVIILEFHRLSDQYDDFGSRFKQFSLGAEFTASENVQLRFGYNNQRRQDLKVGTGSAGLAGLSVGIGIATGSYTIDYGFTSLGSIGGFHRFSVGF
jgi:long-subunit fatty acid transport protein